jgi:1-acyl-sn-glycerol-3-phosphate acyltransferase
MSHKARRFNIAYWAISIFYVLLAFASLLGPKAWTRNIVRAYSKAMIGALDRFAGISLLQLGRLPPPGTLIAAKHHSWFDGFAMMSMVDDVAFVCGDHLLKFWLVGRVLRRIDAVVVSSQGGIAAQRELLAGAQKVKAEGRRLLIYPEGHLSPAGGYHRYRTGIWHLQKLLDVDVVPVATSLGVFAPLQLPEKHPGCAVLEFLDPITPGMAKDAFMDRLQTKIEGRSDFWIGIARDASTQASIEVENSDAKVILPPAGSAALQINPFWRLLQPDVAA